DPVVMPRAPGVSNSCTTAATRPGFHILWQDVSSILPATLPEQMPAIAVTAQMFAQPDVLSSSKAIPAGAIAQAGGIFKWKAAQSPTTYTTTTCVTGGAI
ncbi:MAG: hypothetical protein OEY63_03000, partial [Gemmatimonadota bacterium]|nr:hypothetical protein [Gemmatimonadota bacterium]